jgi:hypothetical protein
VRTRAGFAAWLLAPALLLAGNAGAQSSALAGAAVSSSTLPAGAADRTRATFLRVHATRSHMQCPLPGRSRKLLSIDSPGEWEDTIERQDELTALGRKVRWANERVLVYALETQHGTDPRLESPVRVVRLSQGVLYWPVRQRQSEGTGTAGQRPSTQTRPCVLAIIDRAFWQHIRVVPVRS